MLAGIDFELIRILLAASLLGTASILDIRRREVSDLLWIFFGISAIGIYAAEFVVEGTFDLFTTATSILITTAVSFGIYKSGLFGGADALALITLAIILPTFSGGVVEKIFPTGSAFLLHPIVPLIVLSNAVILSLSQIVFNLIYNARYATRNPGRLFEGLEHESMSKKIMAVMIGYRSGNIRGYAFPIEQQTEGRRQFSFAPRNVETAEYESRKDVWVTHGTPFLVFIFIGFLAMLLIGDLAAIFITLIW
jgi:preflagellin peptidase FlaK